MGRPKGSLSNPKFLKAKVVNTCENCGICFETYPSRARQFCSKKCRYASMGGRIDVSCLNCKKIFSVYSSDLERRSVGGKFCSPECRYDFGKVKVICEFCKNEFITHKSCVEKKNRKCCSWECLTNLRAVTPKSEFGIIERTCKVCGKEFKTTESHVVRGWGQFCSQKCSHTKEYNPQWIGGATPYPDEWTDELRARIRKRDEYLCRLCKKKGYHVHHIDYSKQNCSDENLVTLCVSCHAKTNFNREKWIKVFAEII